MKALRLKLAVLLAAVTVYGAGTVSAEELSAESFPDALPVEEIAEEKDTDLVGFAAEEVEELLQADEESSLYEEEISEDFLPQAEEMEELVAAQDAAGEWTGDDGFLPVGDEDGEQEQTEKNPCGENTYWVIMEDELNTTLAIYGSGETYDYDSTEVPWKEYVPVITRVLVTQGDDAGVTKLGKNIFANLPELSIIVIAETAPLETIGAGAFSNCPKVTDVTIPNSVKTIEDEAFANCTSLASAIILDNVVTIGKDVFKGCDQLNVHGYFKTAAEKYAAENNIGFIPKEVPVNLNEAKVTLSKTSYPYTGNACKPAVSVKLSYTTLREKQDYTVSYSKNVNVGTAVVTVTGKGFFQGKATANFTITAASLENAKITGLKAKIYNGKAQKQNITVKLGSKTLKAGTDYTVSYKNNINAGTASVTVTGKGNYKGSKTANFTIKPQSLKKAKVSGIKKKTYSGKKITQNPTVKVNGRKLKAGKDYTLSYKNNLNAGKATVTITGKGNYTGQTSRKFWILKASITKARITGIKSKNYTGKLIFQAPVVKVNGRVLKKKKDYTIAYKNNRNVGTATMIFTGKGNYKGSAKRTFKILRTSINNADITGIVDKTYTGSAITQTPTVKVGGRTLKNGTDYRVSYRDNVNAGTATVVFTGLGNYKGSTTKTFRINRVSISRASISNVVNKEYTGDAIGQSPVIRYNDRTLKQDTDYRLSYTNNRAIGTATMTVTGIGNFEDSVTRRFEILRVNIEGGSVSGIGEYTYTGSPITPGVSLQVKGRTLSQGSDYTVSFDNNTGPGYATVTFSGQGNYTGTLRRSFAIRPRGTAITFKSMSPAGAVTVRWAALQEVSGYQIQAATDSGFNSGVRSVTADGAGRNTCMIEGMDNTKPYYVRIRTYKSTSSGTLYSDWRS